MVDDAGHFVGRITIDDAVDAIIENAEEAVLAPADPLEDEYTFHLCACLFGGVPSGLVTISFQQSWLRRYFTCSGRPLSK